MRIIDFGMSTIGVATSEELNDDGTIEVMDDEEKLEIEEKEVLPEKIEIVISCKDIIMVYIF